MIHIILLLVFLHSTISCPNVELNTSPRFRLPTNIEPIHYDVTIRPDLISDLDEPPFLGGVTIWIKPTETTRRITLQIRKLSIYESSISIEDFYGKLVGIDELWVDDENEFFIITTTEDLIISETYVVKIKAFEGRLHSDNAGFYLARYQEDGIEKRLGTTQFQSTNARRAFPCLDEPSFKATFKITITRPSNFTSISNEILQESIELEDGRVEDIYRESVYMSTYLVAFVVSQYDYIEESNQRVFARPEAVRDGWCEYALKTGLLTLKALEDYLGVDYTLDKMDQVAIPDVYFSPGAMENWGLVTYKESYLLYSKEHSTTQQLQKIATVISHEFAHQWFGNLVTLQWWKYTWLNEGFATYFENFGASLVETSWRLTDQFIFDVHDALEFDSTNSTTPLNYETPWGSGAPTLITYDKGGAILRMTKHFLTEEIFKNSLSNYLKTLSFSTSTPKELFGFFQETVDSTNYDLGGFTVEEILAPWTDQEGYPVINILRNYENGDLYLEQKRFYFDFKQNIKNNFNEFIWPVPINFMFSSQDNFNFTSTKPDIWFYSKNLTLEGSINNFPIDGFLIANKQQTGFYRVNYDLTNWYSIINHLISDLNDINPLNRAQLINDIFNFAKSGLIDYKVALDLSEYILNEDDYIPLRVFLEEIDYLKQKLMFSSTFEAFKTYILKILNLISQKLSFYDQIDDDHVTKLTRVIVMSEICSFNEENCLENSLNSLQNFLNNSTSLLTPDMQQYVFCNGLKSVNSQDWNLMFQRYLNGNVEFLKLRILNSLGCIENKEVLMEFMGDILDENTLIRKTDRQNAFSSVYNSGKFGLQTALEFLTNRFDDIKESSLNLNEIIKGIGGKFNTVEYYEKVKNLADVHGYDYFESVLQTIQDNIDWNQRFLPEIEDWFASGRN